MKTNFFFIDGLNQFIIAILGVAIIIIMSLELINSTPYIEFSSYNYYKKHDKEIKTTKKIDDQVKLESHKESENNEVLKKEIPAKYFQCKGTTKSGSRCKRMINDPSGYCWQHKNQIKTH